MKRYCILALALVLCCAAFTGCRTDNGNMNTVSPTNSATTQMPTMPATMPATRPATEPVTMAPTEPSSEPPTGDTATENSATEATDASRSRGNANRPAQR